MSLKDAPEHVQLAVDLIQLLEDNQIAPQVVLDALVIVEQDYRNKQQLQAQNHRDG